MAEQQSLLQRLAEELQAQDIEYVRQACCSAWWTSCLHLSPFSCWSLQQPCGSAHHIIRCALLHLKPLRGLSLASPAASWVGWWHAGAHICMLRLGWSCG